MVPTFGNAEYKTALLKVLSTAEKDYLTKTAPEEIKILTEMLYRPVHTVARLDAIEQELEKLRISVNDYRGGSL